MSPFKVVCNCKVEIPTPPTGFLTSLLGCQIYNFTNNNIYFRHFILILFIYFAFDITSKFNNFLHPLITFILSLFIYVLFILFSKMTLFYTILVLFLIVIIAVINKFKRYYNNTLSDNEKKLQKSIITLNEVENLIILLILSTILIGSVKYYFSDINKKKSYRSLNNIDKKIDLYSQNIQILMVLGVGRHA